MDFEYTIDMSVRDYECDLQGIVNNANYLHYLEHARHQYLLGRNIDFARLHREGIDLIVSRIEIDYKHSLTTNETFRIGINVKREGYLRVVFEQEIRRLPDNKLVVKAKVIGVGIRNGRPIRVSDIQGFDYLAG